MMKKVFITRPLPQIAKQMLAQYFLVEENPVDEILARDKLKKVVQEYDGVLTTIGDIINKEILSEAKKAKVISNYAIGLDNIDLELAKSLGIRVCNTPDVVTASTADLTLAILLALVRKIPEARDYVRKDRWKGWEPGIFIGEELHGKTLGILGYGRIGKAVAKRALGFCMKVAVYHRSQTAFEEGMGEGISQVSFEELLKNSDYLSLHVPLTPETKNMIGLSEMKKMAKKPVLINVSRGGIVNTDDLVTALQQGILRGAALDVTAPEPISGAHPLCMMENCLIVPHIGTATKECREKQAVHAAQNLIDNLK